MMVTLSVIGVIMAVAVPSFLPGMYRTELHGAADAVATFLGRARMRAMAERRCVKVELVAGSNTPTQLTELRAATYNTFDCDNPGPLIDGAAPLFVVDERLFLEPKAVTVEFRRPAAGALTPEEVIWRPTGWLTSSDSDLSNDDVEIRVRHRNIAGGPDFRVVLADGHGPLCMLDTGVSPPSAPSCF